MAIQAVVGRSVLTKRTKVKRKPTHSPTIQEAKKYKVSGNGSLALSPPEWYLETF